MEKEYKKTASNLNVSVGIVFNVCKRFEETGDVAPKQEKCHSNSFTMLILHITFETSAVAQRIHEITGVTVDPSTVCWVMHKNGTTRKCIYNKLHRREVLSIVVHIL